MGRHGLPPVACVDISLQQALMHRVHDQAVRQRPNRYECAPTAGVVASKKALGRPETDEECGGPYPLASGPHPSGPPVQNARGRRRSTHGRPGNPSQAHAWSTHHCSLPGRACGCHRPRAHVCCCTRGGVRLGFEAEPTCSTRVAACLNGVEGTRSNTVLEIGRAHV